MMYKERLVQIRNKSLIVYDKPTGNRSSRNSLALYLLQNKKQLCDARAKAYKGTLSEGAIKRMSKAINLLVASAERRKVWSKILNKTISFQLSFITLTIPDNTPMPAKQLHKECLQPLLRWLRKTHGMLNYVWKVEQQQRGQLHYHLTSDCYVDLQELRNYWNKLVERAHLMEGYKTYYQSSNPNSTDVHSVKNIRDLASYLIKYFTKEYQNPTSLDGKLWDCSTTLKQAKYYSTEFTGDIEADVLQAVERKLVKLKMYDRFEIYLFRDLEPISLMPYEVKRAYIKNLLGIRCGVLVT